MNTNEKTLFYGIISLPFIDMLTSLMTVLHMPITIGVLVRGFIIVGITLYLIIMRKKFTLELILLVTSLTIIGINTVIGLLLKDPYHILAELKVSLKVIYYLVMLLITLSVIRSWKSIKIKETIYRAITTVSIIISVSFWIAYLSKTTFSSYSYDKSGISGWYFSANELSAIIVILIGFTIAQVHEKRMDENTLQLCTLILLLSLTPMIGTKTALGGAILLVITYTIYVLFFSKKCLKTRFKLSYLTLILVFLIALPYTPVIENTTHTEEDISQPHTKGHGEIRHTLIASLLSSRQVYLIETADDFSQASLIEVLFGIGYGGHYETEPKFIEMDLFDMFFSFGYIGFLSLSLPLVLVITYLLFIARTMSALMLQLTTALTLSISLLAGHVLFAPAVMTYVALLFIQTAGYADGHA